MTKKINKAVLEKIKRAKEKHTQGGNKFLRIESDKPITVYVLDGTYGEDELFYRVQGIHYLGKTRVKCPRIIDDGECPICENFFSLKEEVSSLKNDLEDLKKDAEENSVEIAEVKERIEQLEEEAKKFSPSVKYAMNVLVKGEKKARILTAPKGVFEDIFNAYASNAEEVNIFDPYNAIAFKIEKTGKGMKTTYTTSMSAYTKPIVVNEEGDADEEGIKAALESRYDLDEEVKADSDEDVEKALSEFIDKNYGSEEGEEEKEEEKRPSKPKKEEEKEPKKDESEKEEKPSKSEKEEEAESKPQEEEEEEEEEKKPSRNAESKISTSKSTTNLQERLRGLRDRTSKK